MKDRIAKFTEGKMRKDLPKVSIGDHVRVYVKIKEGDKARVHPFEGTVIARKGRGISATFTVRRISFGEGLEKVFMSHSPLIQKIDIMKSTAVRRARIYYLRGRVGKKAIL